MMLMTPRDKVLAVILPAALTLVIYAAAYARTIHRETATLREELERQDPLEQLRNRLQTERQQQSQWLAQTQAAQKQADAAKEALRAILRPRVDADRARVVQQLSHACTQNGMALVNSSRDLNAPNATPWLESAAKKDPDFTGMCLENWRLELRGSYAGMLGLLETLRTLEWTVIPVSLQMTPGRDETKPIAWALTLSL